MNINLEGFIKAITAHGGDCTTYDCFYTEKNKERFREWLRKQPKVCGRTLYRGYTFDRSYLEDANIQEGSVIGVDQLTQTSLPPAFTPDLVRASRYVNEYGETGLCDTVPVLFRVHTSGLYFVDIHEWSYYKEELECRCADNARLKVFEVNMMGSYLQIDLEELELSAEPKFKVGDKVIYNGKERTITFMDDTFYDFDGGCAGCRIEKQDELLSPAPKPHYDISNFKPFDKVLVRDCDTNGIWKIELFSHRFKDGWFICVDSCYCQCIPFEGNEHLLGTTDPCDEQYINW